MPDGNQANNEVIISVGDKVDLVVQTGTVYRAMIEDRIENGPFLVAIPSRKGVPMWVEQENDIYLVFYRDTGRYIAQMKVVALERRGEIRYMWLLQKTPAHKNQRRGAYRLPVSFSVQIYEYAEDIGQAFASDAIETTRALALEKADSRDLSVTGISLITAKQYTQEEPYILAMHLTSTMSGMQAPRNVSKAPPIHLTATVKRSIPWRETKRFNTGMQFFGLTKTMSDDIAKFVLTEQQKQIKMRRLRV